MYKIITILALFSLFSCDKIGLKKGSWNLTMVRSVHDTFRAVATFEKDSIILVTDTGARVSYLCERTGEFKTRIYVKRPYPQYLNGLVFVQITSTDTNIRWQSTSNHNPYTTWTFKK